MRRVGALLVLFAAACDFEGARQRYQADFCERLCVEAPGTAGCEGCAGWDGGASDAGFHDAGTSDAGMLDAGPPAVELRVKVDAGVVGSCVPVAVEPVDSQGNPAALVTPLAVALDCQPALSFFADPICAGAVDEPISVVGPSAAVGSVVLGEIANHQCQTSATPPFPVVRFSLESRALLRVEAVDGGTSLEQTRCTPMQLRATNAFGSSVNLPDAGAILVAVDGGAASLSPACDSLSSALTLTLDPADVLPVFYARAADAGVAFTVHAQPAAGVLAEPSTTAFPVTCRGMGVSCGSSPGTCCSGCNALASNTCY